MLMALEVTSLGIFFIQMLKPKGLLCALPGGWAQLSKRWLGKGSDLGFLSYCLP